LLRVTLVILHHQLNRCAVYAAPSLDFRQSQEGGKGE